MIQCGRNCAVLIILFFALTATFTNVAAGERGIMQGMTAAHNSVRSGIGVQGLVWSDELAGIAQEWADHLVENNGCILRHRPREGRFAPGYGENLYWAGPLRMSSGQNEIQQITPDKVVKSWAGEAADYEYESNSCRPGRTCGHYTQVVWKQTARVGCGRAVCADKSQVWVCNYDPAGNFLGQKPY